MYGLSIIKNHLSMIEKGQRLLYGFCGAPWSSAASLFCAMLKAEVATSVLGGFDLNVGRVIYATGPLSYAGLILTLMHSNHNAPNTNATDNNCCIPTASLVTEYRLNA